MSAAEKEDLKELKKEISRGDFGQEGVNMAFYNTAARGHLEIMKFLLICWI